MKVKRSFQLEEEDLQALARIAERECRSLNMQVVLAVREFLRKQKKEQE